MTMVCQICGNARDIGDLETAFGQTPCCWTCFEHRAETPITVHECYQTLDRMTYGSRRYQEYLNLIRPMTCFDGHDVGYVPHIEYLEQKTKQIPACVPQEPDPDDEVGAIIIEMQKVAAQMRNKPTPFDDHYVPNPKRRFFLARWTVSAFKFIFGIH